MSEPYRDSQGYEFEAPPACVGDPTWWQTWNDLQKSTEFLRNTRAAILPGSNHDGFAQAIADGGAVFWAYRDFENNEELVLASPADYGGILSLRLCETGFVGRVVEIRAWAVSADDVGYYMPGSENDNDVGDPGRCAFYVDPNGGGGAGAELRFEALPWVHLVIRVDRLSGALHASYHADPPYEANAAAVRFRVACGPAFSSTDER